MDGQSWSDVRTSEVPFVQTDHGRLRRAQRGFDKKDLQAAVKYGTRESTHPRPNGDTAAKYTYKDITYIVNEVTGEEVTSYAVPLTLDPVPVSDAMEDFHQQAKSKLQRDLGAWTSNTVFIVDVSGSMKEGDMWGTRSRLGGVWVSLALDFLADRLERGFGETDVISVVTLGDSAKIVVQEEPSTWVLYNRIVSIYSGAEVMPRGHGMFLPSLDAAKTLLERNNSSSCTLALTLLTDGNPSDHMLLKRVSHPREVVRSRIVDTVSSLASSYGKRLLFTAIGIGDYDSFDLLQDLVEQAKDFDAEAQFCLPSMTASSLAESFSSVATCLSTTQLEKQDPRFCTQLQMRKVLFESKTEASKNVHTIAEAASKFNVYARMHVKRELYEEWHDENRKRRYTYSEVGLRNHAAHFVAICQKSFGQGKERLAFRFFELAADCNTIVGEPLVAKESLLVLEEKTSRREFVKTFCRTQQLAVRLAKEFNDKMDSLWRIDPATPRVRMLDCSIYNLTEGDGSVTSVLVEERLAVKRWHKWNGNGGFVEGLEEKPDFTDRQTLRSAFTNLDQMDMTVVEEGSDEEEDSDTEEEVHDAGRAPWRTVRRDKTPVTFTASEVAHAFSHFTYWTTGRKRLVCDLQGVYDETANEIVLSDPAIHFHDERKPDERRVHGRTDLGRKGMARFFHTHHEHCGHLCKLVLRGFRRVKQHHPRN